MAKSKFPRNQHEVVYKKASRKSFSCYNCNYIAYSKHHLISHFKVHHNKRYVNFPRPGFELHTCIECHVTYRIKTALDDHMKRKHSDAIPSVSRNIHECENYTFKTTNKDDFNEHIEKHAKIDGLYKLSCCTHCNATFKSRILLDDHVVRKHPNFIASVTRKIYECTKCIYQTTLWCNFQSHNVLIHPETDSSSNLSRCTHCNATLKSKRGLDNHILRHHPKFIASVTRKIHACTKCPYKTTLKSNFVKHNALVHSEPGSNYKLSTCGHCNAIFKSKFSLDDHIIRKHPDFVTSVTRKLYECTLCIYKTVQKSHFHKHMSTHPETVSSYLPISCVHCDSTFKSKPTLDEHILRQHPDYITSITSKLHECSECTHKTVYKHCFDRHMLMHHGTASSYKPSSCVHCNLTFESKKELDEHVVEIHPNFIGSVTRKIYECEECTYKTVIRDSFDVHMLMRHGTVSNCDLSTCVHCNVTFKSKPALDDHIIRIHPDFVASVTRKIYECTQCLYKTVLKSHFDKHTSTHPDTVSGYTPMQCIHCNATYKSKPSLDEHIVRKHPNFIMSITSKLHECTICSYKTVHKHCFDRHMSTHSGYKPSTCIHCNVPFKSRTGLDDHIVRKHPEFIASITSKLHECTTCSYKTVHKHCFDKHMSVHSETASSFKLSTCIHCNATYKSKPSLDEHIVRKHPNFITSITSKLHECTECDYKTVHNYRFDLHMSTHSQTGTSIKLNTCTHCDASFKSKSGHDDHIVKKHPDFIMSITSKLHECTECTYKTVYKNCFDKHMSTHSESA